MNLKTTGREARSPKARDHPVSEAGVTPALPGRRCTPVSLSRDVALLRVPVMSIGETIRLGRHDGGATSLFPAGQR